MARLMPVQWSTLQHIFASAATCLTVQVHGTHFLFLGKQGGVPAARGITDPVDR
jgi:hypothetical protein